MEQRPLSLAQAATALESGDISSRDLVESCLAAADDNGNACAAYLQIDAEQARADADRADAARRAGRSASLFDGVPISIKDNFDVRGQVTRAGSLALADQPGAQSDAACLANLRRAGFIFLGRTHMTEFAYSGLGLNVHFVDPTSGESGGAPRVPGGSSSGAAVSVASGGALAGIGTDTGGSCRIPAAFNGLVGFKPTANRVSLRGCVPLSPSLDSVGSIARTVDCCDVLDRFLSGAPRGAGGRMSQRILVPTNLISDGIDADVGNRFEQALARLEKSGWEIARARVSAFDLLPDLTAHGGIVAIEAYQYHETIIARMPGAYDPRVLSRIMAGAHQGASRLAAFVALRQAFVSHMRHALDGFDGFASPTVPIAAPLVSDCATDPDYSRNNLLCLRNPSIANLMDGCSISLPLPGSGPSAGLMFSARGGADGPLLSLGHAAEACLAE